MTTLKINPTLGNPPVEGYEYNQNGKIYLIESVNAVKMSRQEIKDNKDFGDTFAAEMGFYYVCEALYIKDQEAHKGAGLPINFFDLKDCWGKWKIVDRFGLSSFHGFKAEKENYCSPVMSECKNFDTREEAISYAVSKGLENEELSSEIKKELTEEEIEIYKSISFEANVVDFYVKLKLCDGSNMGIGSMSRDGSEITFFEFLDIKEIGISTEGILKNCTIPSYKKPVPTGTKIMLDGSKESLKYQIESEKNGLNENEEMMLFFTSDSTTNKIISGYENRIKMIEEKLNRLDEKR